MTYTLRPCPFCGGKALAGHRDMGGWLVKCTECKASSDVKIYHEEAILEWSKRAIDAENKRLREALDKAVQIAKDGCLVPPDGGSPTESEHQMCNRIAVNIAALKGGE